MGATPCPPSSQGASLDPPPRIVHGGEHRGDPLAALLPGPPPWWGVKGRRRGSDPRPNLLQGRLHGGERRVAAEHGTRGPTSSTVASMVGIDWSAALGTLAGSPAIIGPRKP